MKPIAAAKDLARSRDANHGFEKKHACRQRPLVATKRGKSIMRAALIAFVVGATATIASNGVDATPTFELQEQAGDHNWPRRVATKADASCDSGTNCRACTTEEDCDECGGLWQPNFPPACLVLSVAVAATHDLQHLPMPREEQKNLIAVNKGTGAVETAALQDNTVNMCPSPGEIRVGCGEGCITLCDFFQQAACCYENQGGTCFCDT